MSLVSMKVDPPENEAVAADSPYGWGLCLYLNEEQVEALGLNSNPPRAGSTVGIRGIAKVVRVTQEADAAEETAEGEDPNDIDVSLSLQITDLEVTPEGATSSAQSASMLYGS